MIFNSLINENKLNNTLANFIQKSRYRSMYDTVYLN